MEKQFSAGGIVVRDDNGSLEVLLIKDRFGRWTWPKGHIEKGESSEEAAVREITEETGLKDIQVLEKVGEQEYSFTLGNRGISKKVDVFLLKARGDEELEVQTAEIDKAVWFTAAEAIETIGYEGSKAILEKAISVFGEKYSEKHSL